MGVLSIVQRRALEQWQVNATAYLATFSTGTNVPTAGSEPEHDEELAESARGRGACHP